MSREHYNKKDNVKESAYLSRFDINTKGCETFDEIDDFIASLPPKPCPLLIKQLVKESGLTAKQIYSEMETSDKTLRNWQKDLEFITPERNNLIKFCLTLHLAPKIVKWLLKKYKYALDDEDKKDRFFLWLIETMYFEDVETMKQKYVDNFGKRW